MNKYDDGYLFLFPIGNDLDREDLNGAAPTVNQLRCHSCHFQSLGSKSL